MTVFCLWLITNFTSFTILIVVNFMSKITEPFILFMSESCCMSYFKDDDKIC